MTRLMLLLLFLAVPAMAVTDPEPGPTPTTINLNASASAVADGRASAGSGGGGYHDGNRDQRFAVPPGIAIGGGSMCGQGEGASGGGVGGGGAVISGIPGYCVKRDLYQASQEACAQAHAKRSSTQSAICDQAWELWEDLEAEGKAQDGWRICVWPGKCTDHGFRIYLRKVPIIGGLLRVLW